VVRKEKGEMKIYNNGLNIALFGVIICQDCKSEMSYNDGNPTWCPKCRKKIIIEVKIRKETDD